MLKWHILGWHIRNLFIFISYLLTQNETFLIFNQGYGIFVQKKNKTEEFITVLFNFGHISIIKL